MYYAPHILVSIHAPTRGATFLVQIRDGYIDMFQSTHPHGVRPPESAKAIISKMFQSTHPHGVLRIPRPHRPYKTRFQSTHPHGVRRDSFGGAFNDIAVSIHAPTRGATRGRISGIHVHYTFQSTHPHGVRPYSEWSLPTFPGVSIHAPTRGATSISNSSCCR